VVTGISTVCAHPNCWVRVGADLACVPHWNRLPPNIRREYDSAGVALGAAPANRPALEIRRAAKRAAVDHWEAS